MNPSTINRVSAGSMAPEWGYRGPRGVQQWPHLFPKCGGRNQSPIDVDTSMVEDGEMARIVFGPGHTGQAKLDGKISNGGHSVKFVPDAKSKANLVVTGGPFESERYVLENFHFHWGSQSSQGSEHTINGHRFPMELHLVHKNVKYPTLAQALGKPDGLAVFAVFFDLDPQGGHHEWMEGFKDCPTVGHDLLIPVSKVPLPGQETQVEGLDLSQFAPIARSTDEYFMYVGSLTTPTCDEGVKWIITKKTTHITEKQMEVFRKLQGKSHPLSDNFRPPQPLFDRKVYRIRTTFNTNLLNTQRVFQNQQQLETIPTIFEPSTNLRSHSNVENRLDSGYNVGATTVVDLPPVRYEPVMPQKPQHVTNQRLGYVRSDLREALKQQIEAAERAGVPLEKIEEVLNS